jgi:hypothetical protein
MSTDDADHDRLACERLIILAYALMDQGQYERSAALFTEDGVWIRGEPAPRTRADILASLRQRPADGITRHLLSNIVVILTGPNEAEASANFLAFRAKRAEDGPAEMTGPAMVGDLFCRLRRGPDGWRIGFLQPKPVMMRAL